MLPYLTVFSFVMFWIKLQEKSVNRKSVYLPIIILSLFAGIRSYKVGTDSENYVQYFVNDINMYNYSFNKDIEYGYQLIEYSLLNFTHNYFWLFFITAIFFISCYLYIIKKYSVDYWFSIFFFLTLGTYTFFFNGLRQGLAMAITALALPFLLDKKFIKFFLVVLLASAFHKTALFVLPFYFIVNSNIKVIYKVIFSFLTSLAVSKFLVNYVASLNPRYEGYKQVSDESGGYLVLGFYVVMIILIYTIIHFYRIRDEQTLKIFTFYSVGTASIVPIAALGSAASGPQRLISYFTWTLILLLPIVVKKVGNKFISLLAFLFSIIYFYMTTQAFSNLAPYVVNPIFEIL